MVQGLDPTNPRELTGGTIEYAPWRIGYPNASGFTIQPGAIWADFVDFGVARQGNSWSLPRIYAELEWDSFYRLGYSHSLFAQDATPESGLELVKDYIVHKNYFALVSDFYQHALMGEWPGIQSESDELQGWLDDNRYDIMQTMRQAVEFWSVKDRMVVIVDNEGRYSAVDPTYYWPIRARWNNKQTVAHLLAYTWHEPDDDSYTNYQEYREPNRIRFVFFDPDGAVDGTPRNEVRLHELDGRIIGRLLESDSAATAAIIAYGEGRSMYSNIGDAARMAIIRASSDNVVLNRNAGSLLFLPMQGYDPGATVATLNRVEGQRVVHAYDQQASPPMYVEYDGSVDASMMALDSLETYIHKVTGVPKSVFSEDGIDESSGVAHEYKLFAAHAKVSDARHGWTRILTGLLDALPDRPEGDIDITWSEDPFVSKAVRRRSANEEFEIGLIDRVTTLQRHGYDLEEAEAIDEAVREEQASSAPANNIGDLTSNPQSVQQQANQT